MSSDRRERTKQILEDSLRLAHGDRAVFLDSVCANDQALRADVESRIAVHDGAGSQFLGSPAPAVLDITSGLTASRVGQSVGPFRSNDATMYCG